MFFAIYRSSLLKLSLALERVLFFRPAPDESRNAGEFNEGGQHAKYNER